MSDAHDPTAHTKDRVRAPTPEEVDIAIIGAGLGGLTAGAMLARGGFRVAVFDGHYVAGGCGTMFSRGAGDRRFLFDIGLHYVGDCQPEGRIPTLLRAAGAEGVRFTPLDQDGFDTIMLPGLTFRIPMGRERYRERLVEHFPSERKAIDRYVRLLDEVEHMEAAMQRTKQGALALMKEALFHGRLAARYQNATIGQFLDDTTPNRDLRAVIHADQPVSTASHRHDLDVGSSEQPLGVSHADAVHACRHSAFRAADQAAGVEKDGGLHDTYPACINSAM